ncbi:MAG: DUF3703 domain-containing protein [Burkholderiales bacterium]
MGVSADMAPQAARAREGWHLHAGDPIFLSAHGDWPQREMLGQLARIFAALLFSRVWVPVGTTGGANVSAFAPMPVPEDLRRLMDDRSR